MSRKDPDQLALPLHPDDGDQQELIRSAQQHLAALRTARRLGLGAAANRTLKQKDVEIVGLDPQAAAAAAKDAHHHGSLSSRFARVWRRHGGHAANGHEDEEEVDDSWFRVDDEEARRTVKLSIGKVPKRAAALVGRTVSRGNRQRRSRRHQGRGDEIVSDDGGGGLDSDGGGGGGDRYELKGMDTAQRGGDDTFARRNRTYTHRHHHHNHLTPITTTTTTAPTSENEDADDGDSFVTLELPARFGTGGGGGGGMGGSNAAFPILGYSDSPNGSLTRIVSPASPSSRSATLFPVDSIVSAGGGAPLSSSGSASGGTPLYNNKQQQPSQQQQILTVDEVPARSGSSSSSRPKISRKTTALTMTSGSGVLTDVKDKDKDKNRDDDVDASARVIETPQSKSPRLSAHRKLHKHHRPAPSAAKHHHPHRPHPHHPHRHHQNSKNKGKDLAAETSGATAFELQVAEALKKAGVIRDEEERVESDVLWEHQRGLVVFGLPKFSGNALFQADPPQWCDASFKPSPFNPHTFPCKPYWVWRDSEFMIDMSGDKDEEGWSYAFRFRSHYWRGEPQPIRSFVRRRRWIRTRVYRPEPLLSGAVTHAHALRNALGLAEVAAHPELGPCGANPSRSPSPSPAPSPCEEEPAPPEPIHDLRTACAALPIADDDKVLLFADSSSPAAFLPGGAVDPRNPFISFRQIKIDAAASMSSALAPGGQKASELEPMWREAVREINYRRAIGVMRARTRVDRQRVELFRLWFGEYDAASKRANRLSVAGGDGGGNGEASASAAVVVKADGTEGAHETAQKEGAKAIMAATRVIARKERSEVWDPEAGEGSEADVDDVWDVVEHRLDDILLLFDYQLSRQTFLTMLLDIHPVKHAYHRYRGYDASSAQRKATLERGLETRLAFYETAMELVRQYGGKGVWMPEPGSPLDP